MAPTRDAPRRAFSLVEVFVSLTVMGATALMFNTVASANQAMQVQTKAMALAVRYVTSQLELLAARDPADVADQGDWQGPGRLIPARPGQRAGPDTDRNLPTGARPLLSRFQGAAPTYLGSNHPWQLGSGATISGPNVAYIDDEDMKQFLGIATYAAPGTGCSFHLATRSFGPNDNGLNHRRFITSYLCGLYIRGRNDAIPNFGSLLFAAALIDDSEAALDAPNAR